MVSVYPLEARGLAPHEIQRVREFIRILQHHRLWDAQKFDEHDAARFLKARNWDFSAATQMWQSMLGWRREQRVDTIHSWFVFTEKREVDRIFPAGLHKTDKHGHPVIVQQMGRVNINALYKVTTEERIRFAHISDNEHLRRVVFPACSRRFGRHIDQVFTIIDLEGLAFTGMMRTTSLLKMYMQMDSNNYPETLAHMAIINAPGWFTTSWGAVKSVLSAETVRKIEILGKDYQAALLKSIPRENLLPEYGGASQGALTDNLGPWLEEPEELPQRPASPAPGEQGKMLEAGQGAGASTGGDEWAQRDVGARRPQSPVLPGAKGGHSEHVAPQVSPPLAKRQHLEGGAAAGSSPAPSVSDATSEGSQGMTAPLLSNFAHGPHAHGGQGHGGEPQQQHAAGMSDAPGGAHPNGHGPGSAPSSRRTSFVGAGGPGSPTGSGGGLMSGIAAGLMAGLHTAGSYIATHTHHPGAVSRSGSLTEARGGSQTQGQGAPGQGHGGLGRQGSGVPGSSSPVRPSGASITSPGSGGAGPAAPVQRGSPPLASSLGSPTLQQQQQQQRGVMRSSFTSAAGAAAVQQQLQQLQLASPVREESGGFASPMVSATSAMVSMASATSNQGSDYHSAADTASSRAATSARSGGAGGSVGPSDASGGATGVAAGATGSSGSGLASTRALGGSGQLVAGPLGTSSAPAVVLGGRRMSAGGAAGLAGASSTQVTGGASGSELSTPTQHGLALPPPHLQLTGSNSNPAGVSPMDNDDAESVRMSVMSQRSFYSAMSHVEYSSSSGLTSPACESSDHSRRWTHQRDLHAAAIAAALAATAEQRRTVAATAAAATQTQSSAGPHPSHAPVTGPLAPAAASGSSAIPLIPGVNMPPAARIAFGSYLDQPPPYSSLGTPKGLVRRISSGDEADDDVEVGRGSGGARGSAMEAPGGQPGGRFAPSSPHPHDRRNPRRNDSHGDVRLLGQGPMSDAPGSAGMSRSSSAAAALDECGLGGIRWARGWFTRRRNYGRLIEPDVSMEGGMGAMGQGAAPGSPPAPGRPGHGRSNSLGAVTYSNLDGAGSATPSKGPYKGAAGPGHTRVESWDQWDHGAGERKRLLNGDISTGARRRSMLEECMNCTCCGCTIM